MDNNLIEYEDKLWDSLIDQIMNGNVIPIIGDEILVEGQANLHKYYIQELSKELGIQEIVNSFSDLVYSYPYTINVAGREEERRKMTMGSGFFKKVEPKEKIYTDIYNIVSKRNSLEPSQMLRKLLSTRQFPFVITTSFTTVVEDVMRELWGNEIRVGIFNTNGRSDDIIDIDQARIPTVYYMFGKVCNRAHQYALTDMDVLNYCSAWIKCPPLNVCDLLSKKYLLLIGNGYNDWLFRFILFSIHENALKERDTKKSDLLVYNEIEDSFREFLSRTETLCQGNPNGFVDEIEQRLRKKLEENEHDKFNRIEQNTDIFISYSRRDSQYVKELYEALSRQGLKVWYDRKNLTVGGDFRPQLKRAIETTQFFVPIFSDKIISEINESHVYRDEWGEAIKMKRSMGRTFIIPLFQKNLDFKRANVDDEILDIHGIEFAQNESVDDIARYIVNAIHKN